MSFSPAICSCDTEADIKLHKTSIRHEVRILLKFSHDRQTSQCLKLTSRIRVDLLETDRKT